jgi:glutamine amidotransferase
MIAIVDYGLGNIKAFINIYKKLNIPISVASSTNDLAGVSKIILPGVGAFDHAMQQFNASGLRNTIEELVLGKKVPVLGICVGMQMLGACSEEGKERGLSWVEGAVKRIDTKTINYKTLLPHMGWNDVSTRKDSGLLKNFPESSLFYFLHSYFFDCSRPEDVVAVANYGHEFAAIINRDNIYGIQCHPEKSHEAGVSLLRNFAEI